MIPPAEARGGECPGRKSCPLADLLEGHLPVLPRVGDLEGAAPLDREGGGGGGRERRDPLELRLDLLRVDHVGRPVVDQLEVAGGGAGRAREGATGVVHGGRHPPRDEGDRDGEEDPRRRVAAAGRRTLAVLVLAQARRRQRGPALVRADEGDRDGDRRGDPGGDGLVGDDRRDEGAGEEGHGDPLAAPAHPLDEPALVEVVEEPAGLAGIGVGGIGDATHLRVRH